MSPRLRDQWSSKSEFLLACVGYGAGFTRIMRFPYICYHYGGGAFLIPYFIMLAFCAVPLLYMEIAVGQLTGVGPIHAVGMLCPLLKGVGIAMMILCFILSTFYITFIGWAFHYFFNSFKSPLPWTLCSQLWNTPSCVSITDNTTDITDMQWDYKSPALSSSDEYFNNHVLHMSDGIDQLGGLVGSLVGYLFLAWILCYICIFKGAKTMGKVVYVVTLLPYAILLALLVRTLTLPGSIDGLYFLFFPNWRELLNQQVWIYAAHEAMTSVGTTYGCLIALSSYNAKRNNIYHDTLVISAMGCITSLVAGCVVFSALGAVANNHGVPVAEVVTGGIELMFTAVPSVFGDIPGSNAWAALFFLMLITFGISTQFPLVQVVTKSILDQFQDKLKNVPLRNELVSLVVCFVSFIFGLMYVTQGGKFMVFFIDYFAFLLGSFVTYFEVMAICWMYGGNRLAREISFSSGRRPYYVFPFFWIFILPVIVSFIAWPSLKEVVISSLGGYKFPVWSNYIGILLSIFCIVWIPFGALHELYKNGQGKSFCTSLFKSLTPTFVAEYTLRKQQTVGEHGMLLDHRNPRGDTEECAAEQCLLTISSGHRNDEILESASNHSPTVPEESKV